MATVITETKKHGPERRKSRLLCCFATIEVRCVARRRDQNVELMPLFQMAFTSHFPSRKQTKVLNHCQVDYKRGEVGD